MPTIKINDLNIYYEIHGEGQPLVLIPGLSMDVSEYAGIVASLSSKNQVIAIDNRGAGRTDKPDTPYSIELMAEDTAGVLQALNLGPAHILGVSMGGRIAAALTLAHPELVRTLILVATYLRRQERMTWAGRFTRLSLRITLLRRMDKYPQPYYAAMRQLEASRSYDCSDRLGEIRVPTLILHGRKDRLAPYTLAQEMHAGIQGSKTMTFDGGHLYLFFQPRQFTDAVSEFLRSA